MGSIVEDRQAALVTGASGDIGAAVALRLASDGYVTVATGRREAPTLAEKMRADLRLTYVRADLTSPSGLSDIMACQALRSHPLRVVVACAGVLELASITDTTRDVWNQALAINLTATYDVVKRCSQKMRIEGGGTIVMIGSRWGTLGAAMAPAYAASKAALRGLHRSLAADFAGTGVRAILVSPGSVAGKMSDTVDPNAATGASPLLAPTDVADLIGYIVSTPKRVMFEEIHIRADPFDYAT